MSTHPTFTAVQLKQLDQQIFEAKTLGPGVQRWSQILLTIKAQGVYFAHAPTWAEFLHKHFPWTEKTVRNAIRLEEFRESQKLITETTGEPIINDSNSKGQRHKASQIPGKLIDAQLVNKEHSSPPTKPAKVVDETGCQIPDSLLGIWNRRGEIEELMAAVSKIKCSIDHSRKEEDAIFVKIDQSAITQLESVYQILKESMLFAVCNECQGRLEVRKDRFCKCCDSTGLQTERQYLWTAEEKRNMRHKANNLSK